MQGAEGSISDFVVALKTLAHDCEFGEFLKYALRDIFVCGLKTEKIQNKLLNEEKLDFEKATQIALTMEMTDVEIKGLKETTNASAVNVISRNYVSRAPVRLDAVKCKRSPSEREDGGAKSKRNNKL